MELNPKDAAREIVSRTNYRPPLNIAALVRDHGITIIRRKVERSVTGVLVVDSSRVTMLLNGWFPESQRRFSLAHLFGHFVMHQGLSPLFVDFVKPRESKSGSQTQLMEREANEFAAELLMPEKVLRERFSQKRPHVYSSMIVQPLAAQFGVSELAFALRLSQLGLASL